MKNGLLIISILFLVFACQTDKKDSATATSATASAETVAKPARPSLPDNILALQKEAAASPSEATTTKLVDAYAKYFADLSTNLTDATTQRISTPVANQYIHAAFNYSKALPQDAKGAEYLQKAGEIARSMRAFQQAVTIYDQLYKQYPDAAQAPQALFMMAFTIDNEMKQKDKARALYETFLQKYPKDEFADDTKFLLENLGKTNEEIIEGFGSKG